MNQNSSKGLWIGVVVVVVVVALGLWWWMSMNQSTVPAIPNGATTTAGTDQTTGTSPAGVITVDNSSSNVVSIAESISGSATFGSWLSSTGVASQLTGAGPYTIFVPTDGSISQLPTGTFTNLSAAEQKRFVQYHIVSGRAIDAGAQTQIAGSIGALSGDALNFSYSANHIPMVNSAIVIAEYKGSNGIVYSIDNVLLPPKKTQ